MKIPAAILTALLFCSTCFAAPKTEQEFTDAVRTAFEAKDLKQIHALTWEKGASAADQAQADKMLAMALKDPGTVETVTLVPLPPGFKNTQIAWGKKFEPTYPPVGLIKIDYKSPEGSNSHRSQSRGYAVIDGTYYMVSGKSTDLGWKGPNDKTFNLMVIGAGQDKVKITVKYNTSGVDLEETLNSPSRGFAAQYISEVIVTSVDDDVDVTLRLSEGMKEPFFTSPPLKGKGEIHYKKKS